MHSVYLSFSCCIVSTCDRCHESSTPLKRWEWSSWYIESFGFLFWLMHLQFSHERVVYFFSFIADKCFLLGFDTMAHLCGSEWFWLNYITVSCCFLSVSLCTCEHSQVFGGKVPLQNAILTSVFIILVSIPLMHSLFGGKHIPKCWKMIILRLFENIEDETKRELQSNRVNMYGI